MKRLFLLLSFLLVFLSGKSQSLVNTIWFGTNPPSINLYFQFGTDTLFYSTGSSYTPLSLYSTYGGQFYIVDLTGTTACTDTGHYSYLVSGNNLLFTFISDNCVSRKNTLTNYNWTLISSTGISTLSDISGISVFPNPTNDGKFILAVSGFIPGNNEFKLYDVAGKIIFSENIVCDETFIDISFVPPGIYLGNYQSSAGNKKFIIVRMK